MIRVLVVEDNVGFPDALVELLEHQSDLEVVGAAVLALRDQPRYRTTEIA